MMLMTKFGKFKLRLIATINLSVLLSLFNIASTTSNYWLRYVDPTSINNENHFAGLWRSCPNQGPCIWKSGIINHTLSFWSIFVRLFITFGTIANLIVIFFYFMAFVYKLNKRSKCAIKIMEWANMILIISFISIMIGFCAFISTTSNWSIWLHVIALIFIIISSNMSTRLFATLYFQNTRSVPMSKSCETAMSHSKIPCDPEEKIALAPIVNNGNVNTECVNGSATIEMNKISEANGSNEALIPTGQTAPLISSMEPSAPTTEAGNMA
jgi:hypothetical protein